MNIVLIDSGQLPGQPEFPPIDLPKFAWLEYVALDESEVDERCWRADVIVSTNTPVNAKVINESYKLGLIVSAGDSCAHIDRVAAKEKGVMVCNIPKLTADTAEDAQKIAELVVDNIHAWLNHKPINVVD